MRGDIIIHFFQCIDASSIVHPPVIYCLNRRKMTAFSNCSNFALCICVSYVQILLMSLFQAFTHFLPKLHPEVK